MKERQGRPFFRWRSMFIPITKVDSVKRIVYGTAADETPDRQREIWDYAGNKPLWEAWSALAAKNTDGKSLGNVRAMHGLTAAGKVAVIDFDDAKKSMEIGSKIVDEAEWQKVEEGVYTGFSVGGDYVSKWADTERPAFKRVIIDPHEISLVDLPANPGALFIAIKADGLIEHRAFKSVTSDKPAPKFGKAIKGMYTVGQLASILESLSWMVTSLEGERSMEGDGSDAPERLGAIVADLGDFFMELADEEIQELTEGLALATETKGA